MVATTHGLRHRRRGHRPAPGTPPGTLAPAPGAPAPTLRLIAYDADGVVERAEAGAEEAAGAAAGRVAWLDVQGLGDIELIRRVGARFGLHPLVIADIVHVHQRPKVEAFDDHLFVVLRLPSAADGLLTEQLALILGEGFVLTFQERPGDCFDPVRERLRQGKGRIRRAGADYLAYALLDAAIDAYFPVVERVGEAIEALEQEIVDRPGAAPIARIHRLKQDLLELRRALWPLRDVVAGLMREGTPFIEPATRPYLRDCADHVFQLMDMIEIDREVASGLVDLHLSSVNLRMNEIMKLLTIIATIFIPLGFIAGVYGMNFDPEASPLNMPELGWYHGYPFALGVMAAVALGLLAYFWRKGWLGGGDGRSVRDERAP